MEDKREAAIPTGWFQTKKNQSKVALMMFSGLFITFISHLFFHFEKTTYDVNLRSAMVGQDVDKY